MSANQERLLVVLERLRQRLPPLLPPFQIVVGGVFQKRFRLIGGKLALLSVISDKTLSLKLLDQVLCLHLIDDPAQVIEGHHLLVDPVSEGADDQGRLVVDVFRYERVLLVNDDHLLHYARLLAHLELDHGLQGDALIPEDEGVDPLVADPALVLLVGQHLPLAAARDVQLVADPALEDEFLVHIGEPFISAFVIHALYRYVRLLLEFRYLGNFDSVSHNLVDRALVIMSIDDTYILFKSGAYYMIKAFHSGHNQPGLLHLRIDFRIEYKWLRLAAPYPLVQEILQLRCHARVAA
jgi:hypothetical protein